MVGTGRFELPTPRTPSECSTRLSHVPTRKDSTGTARGRGLLCDFTLDEAAADETVELSLDWTAEGGCPYLVLLHPRATPNPASSVPRRCRPAGEPPERELSPCARGPAAARPRLRPREPRRRVRREPATSCATSAHARAEPRRCGSS